MRLFFASLTANTQIRPGVHLLDMYAPQLVQAVQPGHYCMVRCCHPQSNDPLLRRPFFIHSVQRDTGICRLWVQARGRGTSWLIQQPAGAVLDILGPLGHGWEIRSTIRNLLLVSEGTLVVGLPLLAQIALEQDLAVTLVAQCEQESEAYPPALLPPEVEYQIVVGTADELLTALEPYLVWSDALFASVSRETLRSLYGRFERVRTKRFAQGILLHPLVCASGTCLTCNTETFSGSKLICRDGPVFDLREITD